MTDFSDATKKIQNIRYDKDLLRYLVTGTEKMTHSEGERYYIHIKPGVCNGISNIDFAQFIYAKNGINLQKHVSKLLSKLEGKEIEVLFINRSALFKLSNDALNFLDETAPECNSSGMHTRATELCNEYRMQKTDMSQVR